MLISLFSPKGGVGNTILTLALAKEAAKKLKVCAVEFDFTPGDFPSVLEIDRRKNTYTAMQTSIEYALQRPNGENFDVIPGGYPDIPERFSENAVKNLAAELTAKFDLVLVDVQPIFCPAVMDILTVSDKVILVTQDNFSVVSRTIGVLDWVKTNNFVDLDKFVQVVNMCTKKGTECINLTGPKIPVIYSVPYIRGLTSFRDIRLKNHSLNILNHFFPDTFVVPRKGLLRLIRKEADTQDAANADTTLKKNKQE